MSIIEKIDDKYEIYRIVTDMEALQEAFRERIEDLDTTVASIDAVGKLTPGYCAKIVCIPPMKSLGPKSLPRMLKATGMALVLVIDDARFAPIKEKLQKRLRPRRSPAIAGNSIPTWLFTKEKAREMGKKRFSTMTEAQRKRHQRKAQKASVAARRRNQQERERTLQPENV